MPVRMAEKKAPRIARVAAPAHLATNGLSAWSDDLTLFMALDPIAQSHEIRIGMEPNIIGRVATEVMKISVQSLLAALRIPSSTVTRKMSAGDRLSSSESDRVARVLLVHAHAADVFEDSDLGTQWMLASHAELCGESPLAMLDTQIGYDEVQRILSRIEFGVGV